MYGAVISFILLFPWALVALATAGHLRSRRAAALVRVKHRREPADLL
jgi:hypothetical protein